MGELTISRLALWRHDDITYAVHAASSAAGEQATVINAIGPGQSHRFRVVWDDASDGFLADWRSRDEGEWTASAEAFLNAT